MEVTMLKDKPSAAVRQSKRKLGLAVESGGWLSLCQSEWFVDDQPAGYVNGPAPIGGYSAAAGKARLVAYPVTGNPPRNTRQANQQKSSNLFVNDRSPRNYLSILISKMQ
jgi:hypothetical protein